MRVTRLKETSDRRRAVHLVTDEAGREIGPLEKFRNTRSELGLLRR